MRSGDNHERKSVNHCYDPPGILLQSELARLVQVWMVRHGTVKRGKMHELHRKAAEQHELAARAHRTAAEHNEKGDNESMSWHEQRAMEYSDHAYKLAEEAHSKSGKIGTL